MPKLSEELLARARELHGQALVAAVHTDLIGDVAERHSQGERAVLSRRHAALFRSGGIRCVSDHVVGDTFETQSFPSRELLDVYNAGRPYNPSLLKHALRLLEYTLDDLSESSQDFTLTTSVEGIRREAEAGKIAFVLCTQGLTPFEDEPLLIELYHRLGTRVVGLVTYRANGAVGSYKVNREYGLTDLGRTLVREADRLRMVLDVSAISDRGFWDVVDLVDRPIIASHSNATGICGYPGNFSDERLKALKEKNGLIALIANGKLVTTKPTITLGDFVDHIDYIANLIGVDHVAIGPDIVEDTFYPIETYRRLYAEEGYWSARYPAGFESHSQLPVVTAELLRRGYSDTDVRKILGENLLRVYQQVWGA
jgi:membrane dipeptidase